MSRLLLSTIASIAIAAPVAAHHDTAGKSHAVATVTITEQVRADGKPLAPGTYEVYCPVGNHEDEGMRLELTVTEG